MIVQAAANVTVCRRMSADDLDTVMNIEQEVYPHPWTRGNFSDSLEAGYHCWIMECAGEIVGYAVLMIALDEAHLLNLSVAAHRQRQGLGRRLLDFLISLARELLVSKVFLEVRPSNASGRALYARAGFAEIATRRDYYPAAAGREDAVIMEMHLR